MKRRPIGTLLSERSVKEILSWRVATLRPRRLGLHLRALSPLISIIPSARRSATSACRVESLRGAGEVVVRGREQFPPFGDHVHLPPGLHALYSLDNFPHQTSDDEERRTPRLSCKSLGTVRNL
jgi:hypothetical protein